MRKKYHLFIFLFLLFIMHKETAMSAEKITLGVPSEWDKQLEEVKSFIKDSFAEIGFAVDFKVLPFARSLKEVVDGQIDGEIARSSSTAQSFNLVIVNPTYLNLQGYAYYKKNRYKKIPTIEDIKKGRVAFVNGNINLERLFKNSVYVVKTNTEDQLKKMLLMDRIDFAAPIGNFAEDNNELGKVLIQDEPIHLVLSQNHKDLALKLEPILKSNLAKKKYIHLQENLLNLLFKKNQ